MQKHISKIALCSALFSCLVAFAPIASAQATNLISNASLETASGSAPSGWASSVWGTTEATFTYPSTGAHSGTRFAQTQVTTKGTGDAKWYPASVAVTPGATYSFSDWYKSSVATEIDLEYTLTTGKKSYAVIGSPAASASWKQFQASFTAPANASSLKLYHLIEAVGTLDVDDFSLTTTASAGTAPVLTQVTPVATSTKDTTPNYVFSSTKAGAIAYGGDCKSAKTAAVAGNNTITFSALAQGTHSNCTLSVKDAGGNTSNTLSVPAFTVDTTRPSVTINQAAGQADPATSSPILFTAVFSEPVVDFSAADVAISGTAGGTKAVSVSGSGTAYAISVSGMTSKGTVSAAIPASVAYDAAGNANTAGTFTDKTVTFDNALPPPPPPPAVALSPSNLASGTTSLAYSQSLTASTSASGPFTWSVASGALPAGLALGNSTSLADSITGTPSAAGTFSFSIKVTNGTSSATNAYTVVIAQPATTSTSNNLVQNGDFETANGSMPANWTESSWGMNTLSFAYPAAGNGGGNAGQINVTSYSSGDAKWMFPQVAIAPNTVYLYSEDFSATVPTEIDVEYTMSDGSTAYKWLSSPSATSGWSNASFSITPPSGAVSFTVFHAITSVGQLSLDNVSLTGVVLKQSSNLVQNGDFEIMNGSSPLGWNASYWGTNTPVFTYPVAGNGGGKAAQVQFTSYASGDAKWVSNSIAASSHTIYRYSEDYKSDVSTNITVEYKKADGTYLYEWLGDLPAASNWTNYTTDITVPTGVTSFILLHALVSVGTLVIDNVDVEAQSNDAFTQGMASLVFDDGLESQFANALPIMDAAGFKGGFYIITQEPTSGDKNYMTWPQIKALASSSEEIGAHTRTHPYLTQVSASQLQSEVQGSKDDLAAQGLNPTTFVYPYGDVNTIVESAVKAAGFAGGRGSDFGLNNTLVEPENLYDIRLDSSSDLATIESYIDQAVADKRWLVFEIHDVLPNSSDTYAITPAFFQSVVSYLKQKNISVVTLAQGLSQLSR